MSVTIFGYEEQQEVHRLGVGDEFRVINARKTQVSDTDISDSFYYNGYEESTGPLSGGRMLRFQRCRQIGLSNPNAYTIDMRFPLLIPALDTGYQFPEVRGRISIRGVGHDYIDILLDKAEAAVPVKG